MDRRSISSPSSVSRARTHAPGYVPPRDRPSRPGTERASRRAGRLLARHPLGFLRRLRARHGDVFALRLANVGRLVVVADPAEARPLAEADPATAHAGEARRRVLPMAPPRSVFGGDGHVHHEARGRVAAAFAPEAQAGREPAMAAIPREHVRTWPRGRPTRALAHVRELMDDLCVRALLGVRDPDRARGLARALNRALRTPGNPPGTLPGGDFRRLDVAARAVWERRRRPVADLLTREIEDRRRAGAEDDSALSLLARADPPLLPDQAVDEILVTLMAAQEPPAIALTWLLLRLGGAPDLAAAVADGDERTTDAVVRETLRLHSAALGSLRRLTQPREAAGHPPPAGTAGRGPPPPAQRHQR